jgi:hypothetical protein
MTKTQTSKKEGKESKNPDTRGSLRGVPGERERERTRREKTGIRWKERKGGAECAMRRRDN